MAFGAIAGAALGGTGGVAAFLAPIAGSVFDTFILNKLFGEENDVPHIGSVDANFAEEGAPLAYCIGSSNRISGQYLYLSLPYSLGSGGTSKLGAPSPTKWFVDAAVGLCANEVQAIERIYFDANLVYVRQPQLAFNGIYPGTFSLYLDKASSVQVWHYNGNNTWDLQAWYATFQSQPILGIGGIFAKLLVGSTITIRRNNASLPGGWVEYTLPIIEAGIDPNNQSQSRLVVDLYSYWSTGVANFNATRNVAGGPTSPPTVPTSIYPWGYGTISYQPNESWAFTPTAINWQTGAVDIATAEVNGDGGTSKHLGASPVAAVSPALSSRVGATNTPGMPGRAWIFLPRLDTTAYGTRAPVVTCVVNERSTVANTERLIAEALTTLCQTYARIPNGFVNTSKVASTVMRGITWEGTQSMDALLAGLMTAFDIQAREGGGILTFLQTDQADQVLLHPAYLDARRFGEPPTSPLRDIHSADRAAIPKYVHVRFLDVDKNLQWGDRSLKLDGITTDGVETETRQLNLQVAFKGSEADAIVQRVSRDVRDPRGRVRLRLPAHFCHVQETDVLVMNAASGGQYQGRDWLLRVDRVDITADWFVEIEADVLSEETGTAGSALTGTPGVSESEEFSALSAVASQRIALPAPRWVEVVDVGALRDRDARTHGVYLAGTVIAPDTPAAGITYYRDVDGGTNVEKLADGAMGVIGLVVGTVPAGETSVVDWSTVITVKLFGNGKLYSTTHDEAAAGTNMVLVGKEVLSFITATPQSDGTYQLTGLFRGLLGTEDEVGAHTNASERLVLLDLSLLTFVPIDQVDIGVNRRFVAAAPQDDPNLYQGATVKLQGWSARPKTVASPTATRLANGDVRFDWQRRSRLKNRTLGPIDPPMLEPTEKYEVAITGTARVLTVYTNQATYTLAQQTTDGTDGSEFEATIRQVDSVTGTGRLRTITVPV